MTNKSDINRDLDALAEVCDKHLLSSSRYLGKRVAEADAALDATLEATRQSVVNVVDRADVHMLRYAYNFHRRIGSGIFWTKADIVPINPYASPKVLFWLYLKWTIAVVAGGMAAIYFMGGYFALAFGALLKGALPYYLVAKKAKSVRLRFWLAEVERTQGLYASLVNIQQGLGLRDPRQLTPFVVSVMAKRYEGILQEQQRKADADKARMLARVTGRTSDDTPNQGGPTVTRAGTSGAYSSGAYSGDSYSDDAVQPAWEPISIPHPAFNIDGTMMMPDTGFDVLGKPYGS